MSQEEKDNAYISVVFRKNVFLRHIIGMIKEIEIEREVIDALSH